MTERANVKSDLDRLIDFRTKFRPDQTQPIAVEVTADTVRRFAKIRRCQDGQKRLYYRDFVIVARGLGRGGEIPQKQLDLWGWRE